MDPGLDLPLQRIFDRVELVSGAGDPDTGKLCGHCQVVEVMVTLDRAARRFAGSRCHLDACLLVPDSDGLVAGAAVMGAVIRCRRGRKWP
jgi:hypothetical protein